MKTGIAIERWKLPIFARHLSGSGYTFETGDGVTDDTMFLYVISDNMTALEVVVRAANAEAAKTGASQ